MPPLVAVCQQPSEGCYVPGSVPYPDGCLLIPNTALQSGLLLPGRGSKICQPPPTERQQQDNSAAHSSCVCFPVQQAEGSRPGLTASRAVATAIASTKQHAPCTPAAVATAGTCCGRQQHLAHPCDAFQSSCSTPGHTTSMSPGA